MSVHPIKGGTVMEAGRLTQRVACWLVGAVVIVMAMGPRPAAAVPWEQRAKLLPHDETVWNSFGYAVDISGTTAVVGALLDGDFGGSSGSA